MKTVALLFAFLGCLSSTVAAADLTVYSARIEDLIKPIFERYTAATGTQIRFITDKEGPLLQRLKAEGSSTPADILLTVDAGNLWHAANSGVLQPVKSELIEQNIPPHLRDPESQWFGLSIRARTVVYNSSRVKPEELDSYEGLASKPWKGRLCLRTSKKVYNQSLVAMMLATAGKDRTEQIVRQWVGNLAAPPFASDNEVLAALESGRCDVGLVNTYYFGRQQRENPDIPLKIFWPNQSGRAGELGGVHVNVSGAGVTRHAPNKDAAIKFLEWLSGKEAQGLFASLNLEYPANPAVAPNEQVADWGAFRQDKTNLAEAGKRQVQAVRLMDRMGYR